MTRSNPRLALWAIRYANVRFGILPAQSGFRRNGECPYLPIIKPSTRSVRNGLGGVYRIELEATLPPPRS